MFFHYMFEPVDASCQEERAKCVTALLVDIVMSGRYIHTME